MPEEMPITPSSAIVDGVASKETVNEPVWVGILWDCHEAELREQPGGTGGAGGAGGVGAVLVRVKFAGVVIPGAVAVTV